MNQEHLINIIHKAGLESFSENTYGAWGSGAMTTEALENLVALTVRSCLDSCYNNNMNDELYIGQLRAAYYIEQYWGIT